jgi:predicted Zn-ribbon and HTH transcriptional regulator
MTNKHPLLEKIPAPASETRRQKIIAELMERPMTARDLSKAVHISEKEVISHLEHVKRSLKLPNIDSKLEIEL